MTSSSGMRTSPQDTLRPKCLWGDEWPDLRAGQRWCACEAPRGATCEQGIAQAKIAAQAENALNDWRLTAEKVTGSVCAGCGVKYLVGPVWCDRPDCPRSKP